jgi:16S rRNA (adenine1518-N6/adenine1519-N6)-dimethyltransferase
LQYGRRLVVSSSRRFAPAARAAPSQWLPFMRAKKRYGQHFVQPTWADKLVDAIQPQADDEFIEIGPGPGALTVRLAPRVRHITAIELDPDMIAALRPALPPNVTLVESDILEADLAGLTAGRRVRVAGNLPYNISSPILFRLLDLHRSTAAVADATLMLQREVAERIEAGPGTKDYGVISILVQLHADVGRILSLPPGAFRPAPKVHSSVIRLTFRPPLVPVRDEGVFASMVRGMFMQRRKTLGNALKPFAATRAHDPLRALAAAGIDPARRPETLQLDEVARLADVFASP